MFPWDALSASKHPVGSLQSLLLCKPGSLEVAGFPGLKGEAFQLRIEAQVRTLDQVHQVLAGTQEMGCQAHNTLEKLFT